MNVAKQIANDIINDQKQILEKTVEYIAKKTNEDWVEMAKKVMDAYYEDYEQTGKYYKQTFNMRRNLIVPVLTRTGTGWEAGMEFDYTKMDHGQMPKFREYDIWENFMYGQHGNEDYTIKRTGEQVIREVYFTRPYARAVLDKYYANYDKQMDKYFDEGVRLAKLGKI